MKIQGVIGVLVLFFAVMAAAGERPTEAIANQRRGRVLDVLEATDKTAKAALAVSQAKTALIAEQDKAIADSANVIELAKKEALINRLAYETEVKATFTAEEGWKREQERVKALEKKLRRSGVKTKLAIVAGVVAAVATAYLLKK